MEKNQVHISIDAEFHMLRHFECYSKETMDRIFKNYNSEQVEVEKNKPGSRFYCNFATDIDGIIDQLIKLTRTEDYGENGNLILSIKSDTAIGECGVVSVDTIHDRDKSRIYLAENRGVTLKHLKVEQLPPSHQFVVILKPEGNLYNFITAFPGEAGLPLPNDQMEETYKQQCKAYWDKHVFLEKQ